MSLYPGDVVAITLSLENPDGSIPVVGVAPTIRIIDLSTGSFVVDAPQAMTLLAGTNKVYSWMWNTFDTPDGEYMALASYAVDGKAFGNRMVQRIRLGDSRVLGNVALEATTAKEATVARDETVMKTASFVSPDDSPVVRGIQAKLAGFPSQIPSVTDLASVNTLVADVHDSVMGDWSLDRAAGTLTLFRRNGSILKQFRLQKTKSISTRAGV